jgi:hypothetical protein
MTQTTRIPFCNPAALAAFLSVSLVLAVVAFPQNPPAGGSGGDEESRLPGTWRGDSLCAEKSTSCHDEIAVYRIASIPSKPGYLMVAGGKVVGGKEIIMGAGEWRHDSAKHTLTVELPRGVITLKVDGDKLEGAFLFPNKTVFRRITLKKSD